MTSKDLAEKMRTPMIVVFFKGGANNICY